MSRIHKIFILDPANEDANEVFAIKAYPRYFDDFKFGIFLRLPELKNQPLKIYYKDSDGDDITIFNALDYDIFREQYIVVRKRPVSSESFPPNPKSAAHHTAPTSTSAAPLFGPRSSLCPEYETNRALNLKTFSERIDHSKDDAFICCKSDWNEPHDRLCPVSVDRKKRLLHFGRKTHSFIALNKKRKRTNFGRNFARALRPNTNYLDRFPDNVSSAGSTKLDLTIAKTSTGSNAQATAGVTVSSQSNDETPKTAVTMAAVNVEPTTTEKSAQVAQDVMIVDKNEDLCQLITALNGRSIDSTEKKKDDRSASIDADKGFPSRESTSIGQNKMIESSCAAGSNNGAIPKRTTPPSVENATDYSKKVDCVGSSRAISKAVSFPVFTVVEKVPEEIDARVNEALKVMTAMGFKNEGGWLSRLLKRVNGDIPNALEMLQPRKYPSIDQMSRS